MPRNMQFPKIEILQIYRLKAHEMKVPGPVLTEFCQKVTSVNQNYVLGDQKNIQMARKREIFRLI